MKPRLIVHVGTDEAGTTYLQQTFRDNYEKLVGQKIWYPKNDDPDIVNDGGKDERQVNHHEYGHHEHGFLGNFLNVGQDGGEKLKNFLAERCSAKDCSTVILSWEKLFTDHRRNYPEFFEKCKDHFDVTTICMMRRPDYFAESYWAQSTKLGNDLQIVPFLNTDDYRKLSEITDNLRRWQGLGSVIAADYEEGKKSGLLEYFNRKAEIPTTVTAVMEIENKTVDPDISANCASALARLREMGRSPDVGAVMSAFKNDRGSLALGSRLRAKLLDDRKDDLIAAKRRYGLEFSDEMPEGEQIDPLEGPSPTALMQAFAAVAAQGAPAGGKRRRQNNTPKGKKKAKQRPHGPGGG